MAGTRSTRNQPWCWQEKKILRLIRKNFEGAELQKLRNLYLTITEIDSDFNGKDIKFYTKTVSTYSGLSKDWIPKGLKIFQDLKMIEIIEERVGGKFKGKKLVFTPDNIQEIPLKPVNGKTITGESINDNLEPSEDILLLEDINNKENNNINDFIPNEKQKKFQEELQTFKMELSMMIREKGYNITPEKVLMEAGGKIEIVKKQMKHFNNKGIRYFLKSLKENWDEPKDYKKENEKPVIKPTETFKKEIGNYESNY